MMTNSTRTVLPDFSYSNWLGEVAPAGTPAPVVNKLSEAFAKIVKMPDVAGPLEAEGIVMVGSSPQVLRQLIAVEVERWRKVVKDNNIKIEE